MSNVCSTVFFSTCFEQWQTHSLQVTNGIYRLRYEHDTVICFLRYIGLYSGADGS